MLSYGRQPSFFYTTTIGCFAISIYCLQLKSFTASDELEVSSFKRFQQISELNFLPLCSMSIAHTIHSPFDLGLLIFEDISLTTELSSLDSIQWILSFGIAFGDIFWLLWLHHNFVLFVFVYCVYIMSGY